MVANLAAALTALIASSPNLLLAVWIIIRQDSRIDKLLVNQEKLIDELMKLHPPQDAAPLVQLVAPLKLETSISV